MDAEQLVVCCPAGTVPMLLDAGTAAELSDSSSDEGGDTMPASAPGACEGAVYCPDCEMWLNGPTQWEDHKIGKKHQKKHAEEEHTSKCGVDRRREAT